MRSRVTGLILISIMLLSIVLAGCSNSIVDANPIIASTTLQPSATISTLPPSLEPTTAVAEVPEGEEIDTLLTNFIRPLVRVRESFPTGTRPTDDELFRIVRAALYDVMDSYMFSQENAKPHIEARYDYCIYEAYVPAEVFARAAKDYLLWDISVTQVCDYYKALYDGVYNLVTSDDEIVFRFGEGDIHQAPFITSCVAEGDTYRLTLFNTMLDMPFLMPDRTAEAVIQINPDSMFGYTLLSYIDEPAISDVSSFATKSGYPLEYAFDGLNETAWVPEEPTGCWIELQFSRTVIVGGIELYSGYMKNQDLLEKNNRVRVLQAEFPDGTVYILHAVDVLEWGYNSIAQILYLPEPCITDSIKLTVLEVYPGSMYDDTCISELSIRPYQNE